MDGVAIAGEHVRRLAGKIEGLGRVGLHPPGEFHRPQPRLERGLSWTGLGMSPVESQREVETSALSLAAGSGVSEILDEFVGGAVLGVDGGGLEGGRKEGAPPVLRRLDRIAARTERYEAGKALVFGAETVGDPGAGARPHEPGIPAIHQHQRGLVVGHLGLHRPHDEQAIGMPRDVGEKIAHGQAALAVL